MITLTILVVPFFVCLLTEWKMHRRHRMTIYCMSAYTSLILLDILTFFIIGKDSITYAQDHPLYYLLSAEVEQQLSSNSDFYNEKFLNMVKEKGE